MRTCGWSGCVEKVEEINPRTGRPFYYCRRHGEVRKKHCRADYLRHKEERNRKTLERHKGQRQAVLELYGRECQCCGETNEAFLTLDHVNGGGAEHRAERSRAGVLADAVREFRPDLYQILCWNCNTGRHMNGGICPHQEAALTVER